MNGRGDNPRTPARDQGRDEEIAEWLDALDSVEEFEGLGRVDTILDALVTSARRKGARLPFSAHTAYLNTIPPDSQPPHPGNLAIEARIRHLMRWNAAAIVLRANKESSELGGHIASFQAAATLYDTGFTHFWHAAGATHGGDLIYYQGHSSPGIYARAFLEGRLSESQLLNFRQEVAGGGLPSYPHAWLLPEFWQFASVSMGLGPILGIYQARFLRYLHHRGLADTDPRKVWVFCGDGEMDEPESLGAISLAGREKLDNLIFVVSCNLQRLDGPVRGNGKIVQELEADFRGAGWNVIKCLWGSNWDPLLAADTSGRLRQLMEECVDGEYQDFKSKDGAYVRKNFFGRYAETAEMVKDWSDEQIWALNRGGHDPIKVYAAYQAAIGHVGQPTVILAKTIKGYGMGAAGEAQMVAHQAKKLGHDALRAFRDRFQIPVTDALLDQVPLLPLTEDSEEMQYLRARREALGGYLPSRRGRCEPLPVPPLAIFESVLKATAAGREISTTMAFVHILTALLRHKTLGPRIVPIVPDESRTFGMEGLFRQIGIFSQTPQRYRPQDAGQLTYYREDPKGQLLEEGITEAGAMASFIAAGTAYSTSNTPMIPFYVFYSMFGFQRFGDLAWAAGDMRTRGFLIGGTSGRTTLNGEGLQHADGHSHILASSIPNCLTYDPTYAYELAVIVHRGLKRMLEDNEDIYFYITTLNENYPHPELPHGIEEGILRGIYRLREVSAGDRRLKVRLLGCGAILREVEAAARMLAQDHGVSSEVFSVTSFTELRRDGLDAERWSMLHPDVQPRTAYLTRVLAAGTGPVIASTDYIKALADGVRAYVPARYKVLGTDGFGRSDYRRRLRSFFEVDRHHVVVAALKALADEQLLPPESVAAAILKYDIDPDGPNPARS